MPVMIDMSVIDNSSAQKRFEPAEEFNRLVLTKISMGTQLTAEEIAAIPSKLVIDPKRSWKRLPDVLGFSGGPYVLSPRLRNEIDKLEPNVQRYRPIRLWTSAPFRGATEHGDYYVLLPPPTVDCIDIQNTAFARGCAPKVDANGIVKGGVLSQNTEDPCAIRAQDVSGHHLWRLPQGWDHHLFCSDELWRIIKDQGMKGWMIIRKCTVV